MALRKDPDLCKACKTDPTILAMLSSLFQGPPSGGLGDFPMTPLSLLFQRPKAKREKQPLLALASIYPTPRPLE